MSNPLTDKTFWEKYWESKPEAATKVPKNFTFHQQFDQIISENDIRSAIELGGFPGYYAVLLTKYHQIQSTLLDYFIYPPVIRDLLAVNELQQTDIEVIQADLFNYQSSKTYDLVFSCGLIEHFRDTADIIRRHITLIEPGGTLFITLPNFRGLNGWFQKTFDRENYDKHVIACMDPQLLTNICQQEGLIEISSGYHARFSVWLENENQKPLLIRLFKKAVWILGKTFTKIIPIESKALSPYIILKAKKPIKNA